MPKEKSEKEEEMKESNIEKKAEKKNIEKSRAKEEQEEKAKPREKLSEKDFEAKVLEMAKAGLTSEKIGEKLRQEDIHPKDYGKISRILKKHGAYIVPEISNVSKKLERIEKHKANSIQDKRAMRERERVFSLLRRQKDYHAVV